DNCTPHQLRIGTAFYQLSLIARGRAPRPGVSRGGGQAVRGDRRGISHSLSWATAVLGAGCSAAFMISNTDAARGAACLPCLVRGMTAYRQHRWPMVGGESMHNMRGDLRRKACPASSRA